MKVYPNQTVVTPDGRNSRFWVDSVRQVTEAAKAIVWPLGATDGKFTIYPESGKKKGQGNGVVPIKLHFLHALAGNGWFVRDHDNPERFDAVRYQERGVPVGLRGIQNIPLSPQARGIFERLNILTIGRLFELSATELEKTLKTPAKDRKVIKNFKDETFAELKSKFSYIGVEWETGNVSSGHRSINRVLRGAISSTECSGGILVTPTQALAKYLTDRVTTREELMSFGAVWERLNQLWSIPIIIVPVEHDAESLDVEKIPKGTDGRALG